MRAPTNRSDANRRHRRIRVRALLSIGCVLLLAGGGITAPASSAAPTFPLVDGDGPGGGVTPGSRWSWPLHPRPAVLRAFDPPETRYGPGHRGLDLSAPPGGPVVSVADGMVTHSGVVAGRGTVTVRHAGGLESTYEPLGDRVTVGSAVMAGDVVGTVDGPSHCAPTACLHLGARLEGHYLDPMLFLGPVRIVLLPLLP